MVQVNSHGGGCCGARHLRGFGEAENNNPNRINTALSTVPPSRMTEVILNDTQVRSYPNILRRLADLGFVLDSHWINGNHNSHNYRFSRCDNRQILELAGWNGMVMSPGLHGTLPRVPGANNAEGDRHLEDEALAPAPVIPPPVARIVLTTYHCVFADGRRGAGYDTYDEAWAARGRRTRVDRRRVMSDGEIIWAEQVDD